MVFLGFGKFARADKIYALEPLRGDARGDGNRTRVWVEGLTSPIIASRTESERSCTTWAKTRPRKHRSSPRRSRPRRAARRSS
jgi:hypothetical protein